MWLTRFIRKKLSEPFFLPEHASKSEFVFMFCGVMLRRGKLSLGLYDRLTRLAAKHRSDKGVTIFPFNHYTVCYDHLLRSYWDRPINILEIGLARRDDRRNLGATCPSLNMWLDYFREARVYGFDIDDFTGVRLPRTRIFRGDQGSPDDLRKIVDECPSFDIVIDDGSHASYHQLVTLKTLFPSLKSGGLYIIEDLLWQPADLEASLPPVRKMRDILKDRAALDAIVSDVDDVRFFCSEKLAVLSKR